MVIVVVYIEKFVWFGVVFKLFLSLDFEDFFKGVDFIRKGNESV